MSSIKELQDMVAAYNTKIQEEGKQILANEFLKVFKENSGLKAVTFTAYTPYFNDGDVCEYGVDGLRFIPNENAHWEGKYGQKDAYSASELKSKNNSNINTTINSFEELVRNFNSLGNNFYKIIFGDHVQVKVTLNPNNTINFEVEEFEHE